MRRRRTARLAAAAACGGPLLLALAGCGGAPEPRQAETVETVAPRTGESLALPVDLYFPRSDGLLGTVPWKVSLSEDPADEVREVLAALLAGPSTEHSGLLPPFPAGVEIGGVYLSPEGVAFVDLRSPEGEEPPATGSKRELQMVYSLVNSIAMNIAEARRVAVLWNGHQRPTLAGHVDTSHPLAPAPDLIVR